LARSGKAKRVFKPAGRAAAVEYAIRDVLLPAKELERKGMKILYLNIGDPLKYDFDTPEHIKEALYEAVKAGKSWYGPSEGLPELREAIAEKEKRYNGVDIAPEDVMVTAGVSEAMNFLMAASLEPGDEVLVPGPTYPPYISYAKFYGAKPVPYRTVEEEGWRPDLDDLRAKITDRTKLIVLINPNNPCGAVYDEKTVRSVLDIAGEHGLPVASDEIYDRIVYEGSFRSTASLAEDVPVIGLNGFSKVYLMTGWRLGYLYFRDPEGALSELREAIAKLARVRLCPSTPIQAAAVAALRGPQDHVAKMVGELRRRRDLAYKRISEIEGLSTAKPMGAFFLFPRVEGVGKIWHTDKEFVLDLLKEKGVLVVHGSGFCPIYGQGHFRVVFLPPPAVLEEAMDKIEEFMRSRHPA